ncbi:hypothetical protein ACFXGT_23280 [Streptomyces sp. NPDC059352]|uniref:hypothetical protein n=1 Tax=Streptomyces sp. NPDC059352 TaxID=3346810 RepID=UPI0036B25AA1
MSGFELLREIRRHNAEAQEAAFEETFLFRQGPFGEETARRERVETGLWRALVDSGPNG